MASIEHHAESDDHGHRLAHTATIKVLCATGALLFLTLVTVLATRIDFGAPINLGIAIAIAVSGHARHPVLHALGTAGCSTASCS
jgi:hypothetical protein